MKKKVLITLSLSAGLALATSFTVFAGQWSGAGTRFWRWTEDDGTYPISTWKWIDGNKDGIAECYYFDENGYALNYDITKSPDGYDVSDAAWMENGILQTKIVDEELANSAKTRLNYSGLGSNGYKKKELLKDNSEYLSQYSDLKPGKVYTYEYFNDFFANLDVAIIKDTISNDIAKNSVSYYQAKKQTETYEELDLYDANKNLIGKMVSQLPTDTEAGYVRIFGYY